MKEVTIKTIGWTTFGICFLIMFYGMFIAMSISNMDSEFRTIHTINMDNETKEALIKFSEIDYDNCESRILNNSLHYEKIIKQLEIRSAKSEYILYETYGHHLSNKAKKEK